jgi:hypothetical protein
MRFSSISQYLATPFERFINVKAQKNQISFSVSCARFKRFINVKHAENRISLSNHGEFTARP